MATNPANSLVLLSSSSTEPSAVVFAEKNVPVHGNPCSKPLGDLATETALIDGRGSKKMASSSSVTLNGNLTVLGFWTLSLCKLEVMFSVENPATAFEIRIVLMSTVFAASEGFVTNENRLFSTSWSWGKSYVALRNVICHFRLLNI